ncbi:MAG: hypothetical protein KIT72_02800 [Polyangiaceae bacterium]|nr:hypothetical protein [Polyangiaceae bacterium]MCW5789329.1 hypothetical protein [Polyangiaceae bacterium]
MHTLSTLRILGGALLLLACGCSKRDSVEAVPTAAAPPASAEASAPAPPVSVAAAPSTPTAADASGPASAAATASAAPASPCPEGARRDEGTRYCIVFGAKPLAVSYDGDSPAQGIEEKLEVNGIDVLLRQGPARGQTVASLQASHKPDEPKLTSHSALPEGSFARYHDEQRKTYSALAKIISGKFLITCSASTQDAEKADRAASICQSLRAY